MTVSQKNNAKTDVNRACLFIKIKVSTLKDGLLNSDGKKYFYLFIFFADVTEPAASDSRS